MSNLDAALDTLYFASPVPVTYGVLQLIQALLGG